MDAMLVCIPKQRVHGTNRTGDFRIDDKGRLVRGAGYFYGGVQIVNPERLSEISDPVFSLNRLWDILIAEGRCFGCVYPGSWCDVGTPDALRQAEAMLAEATDD